MTADLPVKCPWCKADPKMQPAHDGSGKEALECVNEDCPVQPSTDYMEWPRVITAWNMCAPTVVGLVWKCDVEDYRKPGGNCKQLKFEHYEAKCPATGFAYGFLRITKTDETHRTELCNGKVVDGINSAKLHYKRIHERRIKSAVQK